MKPRILLAIILFLVIPTAALSILAGRFLKNREFFLDLLIKSTAVNGVRAVSERVDKALDDDLEDLRIGVSDALASGAGMEQVGRVAVRVAQRRQLMARPFVFMNPWGFVHPRTHGEEGTVDSGPPVDESLAPELQKAIAASESWDDDICVTVSDASYCFRRISETRALYVGYEVDAHAALSLLSEALHSFSGGGVKLCAIGPGIRGSARLTPDGSVVVRDSFTSSRDVPSAGDVSDSVLTDADSRAVPLAQGRLRPPFDFIQVCAREADSASTAINERLMLHLMSWGVLLLVGAIIIGVWVVLRETSYEVRQARSKSDFVIGISHDLRTPLASMKMLSESLFEGRVSGKEKEKQFLGLMVRECERLNQLVERVLFFVRFGQNALVFKPAPADVGAVVAAAVASFEARFRMSASADQNGPEMREHASVEVQTVGPVPPARVDESAMVQVLLNLLDNAWKYSRVATSAGGAMVPPITVTLRTVRGRRHRLSAVREWLTISVRDHGMGIPPRVVKRVFRRFYRGPAAEDSNVSGVGLGLALCRHVVKAHGGWIEVASRPGEGSTFTVCLPVLPSVVE